MAKDPAFLFYSSDFITGTIDMTMEERGQYITLLCLQHQKGHLSEKTCRICLGLESVNEIENVISKFSIDENGLYYNKRLEIEMEKRSKAANASRNNGKLGGRPAKKNKPNQNLDETCRLSKSKPRQNLSEDENDNIYNLTNKDIPNLEEQRLIIEPPYNPPTEEEVSSVFRAWDRAAGQLMSPRQSDMILELVEKYGARRVEEAIDIAVKNNGVSISYISKVLRNKANGVEPDKKTNNGAMGILGKIMGGYSKEAEHE